MEHTAEHTTDIHIQWSMFTITPNDFENAVPLNQVYNTIIHDTEYVLP